MRDAEGFTTSTLSLTMPYAAPELLEKVLNDNDDGSDDDGSEEMSAPLKMTSKEADIYAFAILSAEVCTRSKNVVFT
jgi:hypothetical protein